MLQYFFPKNSPNNNKIKHSSQLEYFYKLTPEDNCLPRVLHKHTNTCEIIFIYQGSGTYFVDNHIYEVTAGDIIICNANTLHEEVFLQQKTLGSFCLGITNLQIDKLQKNHLIDTKQIQPIIKTHNTKDTIYTLCTEIYQELKFSPKPDTNYCNIILHGIIYKILNLTFDKKSPLPTPDIKLAIDAKTYIEDNYTDVINLDTISHALKANKYYISHLFKKHFGYPLHQYIIRLRIGEAQNLLINTELNITDIALKVGYNNSNYFQNVFREYIGSTPRKYRKFWRG